MEYNTSFGGEFMWQGLFINACVLITFIFITSQVFHNTTISPKAPIGVRLKLGLIGGITSVVLIYFSIPIGSNSIIEFRDITLILVAIFGGVFPAVIAGLITALFRLNYYGVNYTSIVSFIMTIAIAIGCGAISLLRIKIKMKSILLLLYSLIVRSIAYLIVLEDKKVEITIISSVWLATIVLSAILYNVVNYLVTAHNLLKKLKLESSHDFLTGLHNTRKFDIHYNAMKQEALEKQSKIALLIIDIDHFKNVNDTYGHIAGDAVLKELGLVLLRNSRTEDLVSRIGGEEFAIVTKDKSIDETKMLAERIRQDVARHHFPLPNGKDLSITVSVGAAIYPDTVQNIERLKEASDTKLYESKSSGRNKVCI